MGYSQVLSPELFEQVIAGMKRKKPPSPRNQQIAEVVRQHGRTQVEVAAEYGLSQRRVSQICRQVEDWQASTQAWERGEVDGDARRRSDWTLQRGQLTEVYRRSMRAFARSERPLATRRRGKRAGGGKWSERCEREQKLDTGSLRVALRAIEMQWKLADRPSPEKQDEQSANRDYLNWVLSVLMHLRQGAEKRGDVPRVPGGPQAAVEQMVRELLGSGPGEREGEAPAEPRLDEVPASTAPTIGRGVGRADTVGHSDEAGRDDVGGNRTLTNGQGFEGACFGTTDGRGLEERLEQRVEAPSAAQVVSASAEPAPSCAAAPRGEVPAAGPQNFVNRSAALVGESNETKLAELERKARFQLEYEFGMAMSHEEIAEELKFLRHWEAGRYSMTEQSRGQRAALYEWERVRQLREESCSGARGIDRGLPTRMRLIHFEKGSGREHPTGVGANEPSRVGGV